jgi:futalosine hydrolase
VTSASASAAEAAARRAGHPRALLEDMEGYAVALAALLAGAPLAILRAVSNSVGERDKSRWEVHAALAALRAALTPLLGEGPPR